MHFNFSLVCVSHASEQLCPGVPKTILETMEILPVKNVDEVLKVALTKPLKRVEWVEVDQIAKKNKTKKEELSTH